MFVVLFLMLQQTHIQMYSVSGTGFVPRNTKKKWKQNVQTTCTQYDVRYSFKK